jgi:hypothetical protein
VEHVELRHRPEPVMVRCPPLQVAFRRAHRPIPPPGCILSPATRPPWLFDRAGEMLEPVVPSARIPAVATPPKPSGAADPLDERDRAILDFERGSWQLSVAKERAIRERFGFSSARYHQLLNRIVDRPEALEYDPMLVRRLRRVREARRRRRVANDLGLRV